MTEKKEDLRVRKTKRSIKTEFYALLQKKPIEKISVKELCENAMINKGTFYLHYADIYTLYRELIADCIEERLGGIDYFGDFFTDPHGFVKEFMRDFSENSLLTRFPYMDPARERLSIPRMVDEALLGHVLATGCVADSAENRVRILCCFSAMTAPLMHFGRDYADVIASAAGDMTAAAVQTMLSERE